MKKTPIRDEAFMKEAKKRFDTELRLLRQKAVGNYPDIHRLEFRDGSSLSFNEVAPLPYMFVGYGKSVDELESKIAVKTLLERNVPMTLTQVGNGYRYIFDSSLFDEEHLASETTQPVEVE